MSVTRPRQQDQFDRSPESLNPTLPPRPAAHRGTGGGTLLFRRMNTTFFRADLPACLDLDNPGDRFYPTPRGPEPGRLKRGIACPVARRDRDLSGLLPRSAGCSSNSAFLDERPPSRSAGSGHGGRRAETRNKDHRSS